jgi:hypothetical protein
MRVKERTIELPGKLDDSGTISIGYFRGRPAKVLSAADLAEAPEKLNGVGKFVSSFGHLRRGMP